LVLITSGHGGAHQTAHPAGEEVRHQGRDWFNNAQNFELTK